MGETGETKQTGTSQNPVIISVVVATYNRGDLIKECLDSLVSQQFPTEAFEIIVIDSSSTEVVKKIIAQNDSFALSLCLFSIKF